VGPAGPAGVDTPWAVDHNASNHKLTNVKSIGFHELAGGVEKAWIDTLGGRARVIGDAGVELRAGTNDPWLVGGNFGGKGAVGHGPWYLYSGVGSYSDAFNLSVQGRIGAEGFVHRKMGGTEPIIPFSGVDFRGGVLEPNGCLKVSNGQVAVYPLPIPVAGLSAVKLHVIGSHGAVDTRHIVMKQYFPVTNSLARWPLEEGTSFLYSCPYEICITSNTNPACMWLWISVQGGSLDYLEFQGGYIQVTGDNS